MNREQEKIKFYIVIPVYKTEKYIQECIMSVLSQTHANFEVILVDDGSPDQAGEICDVFAQRDSRFHVIHKVNEGQLSARSAGISYVKEHCVQENAYFVFVDSDDYLQPDALKILSAVIQEKCCDVVIYGIQSVYDGKHISALEKEPYIGSVTDKRELYKIVFFGIKYNSLCRKAISCSLFSDEDWSPYYRIRHGEDLLQSIPIYKKCRKTEFIDTILYNYRVNSASVTHSISPRSYTVNSTVRKVVWDFLQQENVLTEQDMEEYLDRCRSFLRTLLISLCGTSGKYTEYCALLEAFRKDSYYSMLLEGEQSNLVLAWLKNRRYGRLIIYAKCRTFAAKIYHGIRKSCK